MKALVQERYGEPAEVLEVRDVEQPAPAADQVLVRVAAASINIGDCFVIRGVPKAMRPIFGLRGPRRPIPGTDIAGTVDSVGSDVTGVKAGDEIIGWGSGAFAEFAVVAADAFAPKPSGLSWEHAAAIGVSAQTALQALRDQLKVQPGQSVLITGASGGVGTFAVQIAKALGAEVTGVCSTRNVELVRSIGADHVIDYSVEDFTAGSARYDLIVDNVAAHSSSATRSVLSPGGKLLSNGAPVGGWFGGLDNVIKALVGSIVDKRQARPFVSTNDKADLATLTEMAVAGTITPVIDQTFTLDQGVAAVAHVAEGHARGKTVITM